MTRARRRRQESSELVAVVEIELPKSIRLRVRQIGLRRPRRVRGLRASTSLPCLVLRRHRGGVALLDSSGFPRLQAAWHGTWSTLVMIVPDRRAALAANGLLRKRAQTLFRALPSMPN
jgi:hypothetical protein